MMKNVPKLVCCCCCHIFPVSSHCQTFLGKEEEEECENFQSASIVSVRTPCTNSIIIWYGLAKQLQVCAGSTRRWGRLNLGSGISRLKKKNPLVVFRGQQQEHRSCHCRVTSDGNNKLEIDQTRFVVAFEFWTRRSEANVMDWNHCNNQKLYSNWLQGEGRRSEDS